MRFTQHASNNGVMGAPTGWDQAGVPVGALPVTHAEWSGVRVIHSFWVPDEKELAALNAGKPVVLTVVGPAMSPVCVWVDE